MGEESRKSRKGDGGNQELGEAWENKTKNKNKNKKLLSYCS